MGRIVGIDLGTTTSEIAYIKNGKPEIIKNGNSSITPSVVGFNKNYEIIVGDHAKNQLEYAREMTVAEVKRKMGTDEQVVMGGKRFTPVDISAIILKELKRLGEDHLREPVTEAVITVPANFNDAQRQATKSAGEKAGLTVARIINEPTAAALAFGIDNMETEGKILVYDLGGGTFDVTVLDMMEGALDVLASRGMNRLGGKDFDELIAKEVLESFRKAYGIDLSRDLKALGRIKAEAERAKMTLSNVGTATVNLPFIAFSEGAPVNFEMDITRTWYEDQISGYIKQTMDTVDEALSAARVSAQDIDIVLAVGGSSRTPLVIESLKKRFGGEKLRGGVNPDEAVALGAAVQAGIQNNEITGTDSIAIFDVCNHTLGTQVVNRREDGFTYSRIIMRDTHLPFAKSRKYRTAHDFQTEITVEVYQGEDDDLANNTKIGEVHVEGIPENYKGEESFDIEFRYNINGMLEVNVTVDSTGKVTTQKIDMYAYDAPKSRSEAELDELEWENYSLGSDVKTTTMLYQSRRDSLPESARSKADMLMQQLMQAVRENDAERVGEIDNSLTSLLFEF